MADHCTRTDCDYPATGTLRDGAPACLTHVRVDLLLHGPREDAFAYEAEAETDDLEARIAFVLAEHQSGPNGCTCGGAPDVFWDRELRAHVAQVIAAVVRG